MTVRDVGGVIDAVWRMEAGKIIGGVMRVVGDVGVAEEVAQDAVVQALERWPATGVPRNPGAWLMTTARRRAIDRLRRGERYDRKLAELGRDLELERRSPPPDAEVTDAEIDDDLLRLIFVACHPVLSPEARVALTLRLLGGLTTDEIARAFLATEAAVGQRILRAKRALADAEVPFEVPAGAELTTRLDAVLDVLYLIFNEGYSATAGADWLRPDLCREAQRLGRVLAGLMPAEPEVHGLVALMEIQASRTAARVGPEGEPVLLPDQDRTRWDWLLVNHGLAALARAEELSEQLGAPPGPYALQAAIAACHARARQAGDTDWPRIAALYRLLSECAPSPVVELNRAVAVAMADGPAAGLDIVDGLLADPALRGYHLLPSVRGDLLARLGRLAEARGEFERAATLTRNERERRLLLDRAADCGR